MINLDSICDLKHFNIANQELMSGVRFDKELEQFAAKAMEESEIKYKFFSFPMGGTDGSPLEKIGVTDLVAELVVFNAQRGGCAVLQTMDLSRELCPGAVFRILKIVVRVEIAKGKP